MKLFPVLVSSVVLHFANAALVDVDDETSETGEVMEGRVEPAETLMTEDDFVTHKIATAFSTAADVIIVSALVNAFHDLSLTGLAKAPLGFLAAGAMYAGTVDPVRNPTRDYIGGMKNVVGRLVQTYGYMNILACLMMASEYEVYLSGVKPRPQQIIGLVAGFAAMWYTRNHPSLM